MVPGLEIAPRTDRGWVNWVVICVFIALIIGLGGWYGYRWYTTGEPLPLGIPVAKADPSIDETPIAQQQIDSYTVPASNPKYISIDAIGVGKTRIFPVGVTTDNILDTPRNIHDAAWYKKSATPGQGYGAVLIDAHNGGNTKDGVFARLSELKPGDTVTVERGDGKTFTYEVTENQTMPLDEVNRSGMKRMMKSPDTAKEGLSLITCAGKWVPQLGQFDQRVLVRAVAQDKS